MREKNPFIEMPDQYILAIALNMVALLARMHLFMFTSKERIVLRSTFIEILYRTCVAPTHE